MNKFHILKDMDGVETNWDSAMHKKFQQYLPEFTYLSPKERTFWEITENYPTEHLELIRSFWYEPGFFLSLEPMSGSVESTEWMIEQGFAVTFCTSPLYSDDPKVVNRCIDEKREYLYEVYKHIVTPGEFFSPKSPIQFIDAYDKTRIHGHVLIDDKPDISGVMQPTWKHLLFSEGYPFSDHMIRTRINWDLSSQYFYQTVLLREYQLFLQ
jgi:5'(3')-deoxyribonucleotidase